jgi:hypothetical protein
MVKDILKNILPKWFDGNNKQKKRRLFLSSEHRLWWQGIIQYLVQIFSFVSR